MLVFGFCKYICLYLVLGIVLHSAVSVTALKKLALSGQAIWIFSDQSQPVTNGWVILASSQEMLESKSFIRLSTKTVRKMSSLDEFD